MSLEVVFTQEASEQLAALYRYVANTSSPGKAKRFTDSIVDFCEGLGDFPLRGNCRDDIRTGLRITHFQGRAVVAFALEENRVAILGVFYAGRNYESLLKPPNSV